MVNFAFFSLIEMSKALFLGKILLSIANSTSECSAQNLGSKVTNRRRGSFPRGHDKRSQFQVFFNMYCLDASTLLVVYEILCYLLFSIRIVTGQFSSKWPGLGCCTGLLRLFPKI